LMWHFHVFLRHNRNCKYDMDALGFVNSYFLNNALSYDRMTEGGQDYNGYCLV
jgi:hypothetical protein